MVVAGDFNTDIMPCAVWIRNNVGLSYTQDHLKTQYNTENRVQYRNPETKYGITVFQRSVDGVFYDSEKFSVLQSMTQTSQLDTLINQNKIQDIKDRLQKCEDQSRILEGVKSPSQVEVGFPNSKWPSDHLPVGAILQIK